MVSKIIKEFLVSLQFKLDIYLQGSQNQVKLSDIKKVVRISSSLDSLEELRSQFDAFDLAYQGRVTEIEAARAV